MEEFYQQMKTLLQESRAEIVKTFVANNESFKQLIESVDPKDFGDIASEDTDRKMLENMSEKDSKRLQMIDSALARLEVNALNAAKKYRKLGLQPFPMLPCVLNVKAKSSGGNDKQIQIGNL